MRISNIIISIFLTWVAYDSNLFRRRRSYAATNIVSILPADEENEKVLHKKKIQHRLDVIPKRHRLRQKRRERCNYFSTKPRDVRFSDQMKIRRMFNNM